MHVSSRPTYTLGAHLIFWATLFSPSPPQSCGGEGRGEEVRVALGIEHGTDDAAAKADQLSGQMPTIVVYQYDFFPLFPK
jgi:hypothetical protein